MRYQIQLINQNATQLVVAPIHPYAHGDPAEGAPQCGGVPTGIPLAVAVEPYMELAYLNRMEFVNSDKILGARHCSG
jgi:hypothetical protein